MSKLTAKGTAQNKLARLDKVIAIRTSNLKYEKEGTRHHAEAVAELAKVQAQADKLLAKYPDLRTAICGRIYNS